MNIPCEVLEGPEFIKLAVLSHDLIMKGSKWPSYCLYTSCRWGELTHNRMTMKFIHV